MHRGCRAGRGANWKCNRLAMLVAADAPCTAEPGQQREHVQSLGTAIKPAFWHASCQITERAVLHARRGSDASMEPSNLF